MARKKLKSKAIKNQQVAGNRGLPKRKRGRKNNTPNKNQVGANKGLPKRKRGRPPMFQDFVPLRILKAWDEETHRDQVFNERIIHRGKRGRPKGLQNLRASRKIYWVFDRDYHTKLGMAGKLDEYGLPTNDKSVRKAGRPPNVRIWVPRQWVNANDHYPSSPPDWVWTEERGCPDWAWTWSEEDGGSDIRKKRKVGRPRKVPDQVDVAKPVVGENGCKKTGTGRKCGITK